LKSVVDHRSGGGVGHDETVMQQLGEAAHRAAASAVRTQ
jgi:hypothetical protein